jgi:Zn-dependent protease
MRGSFRIATVSGIPVQVHWSFGFVFLLIIYLGKIQNASWLKIGFFSLFTLVLFFCVLLHEFGHALSARYYGVNTRDITLLPVGGVARLDKIPEKPFQEFIVAIAGPAVNLVIYIAIALYLSLAHTLDFDILELLRYETDEIIIDPNIRFLVALMQANLMLVVFNMVPAFPMDGGRVLRASLSVPFGRLRATEIAAALGQIIALGFLVYAVIPLIIPFLPDGRFFDWLRGFSEDWSFQPVLALISFFIILTARSEFRQVQSERILREHTVAQVMRLVFTQLTLQETIHRPVHEFSKGFETNFLVFDEAQILRGVLGEDEIAAAMKKRDVIGTVADYTRYSFQKTHPQASLREVYEKMEQSEQYILPVYETQIIQTAESSETLEQLVAVVDLSAIENFIRFKTKPVR